MSTKIRTFYDSDLETAYVTLDGLTLATLNSSTDILEFHDEFTKEDEEYYESLLIDEIASHNYHQSMMSTDYD